MKKRRSRDRGFNSARVPNRNPADRPKKEQPRKIRASHRKAERPDSLAAFTVFSPVLSLALLRAVARAPAVGTKACGRCSADRAGITGNHSAQIDFEQHPFEGFRIEQVYDWTVGEVE